MLIPTNLLDELADAPPAVVRIVLRDPTVFFERVGTVVEYEFFRRSSRPELPAMAEFTKLPISAHISALFADRSIGVRNLSLQATVADAIAVPPLLGGDPAWTAFIKRAEATARVVGLAESVAAGLAGAIHEMADNIVQHSNATDSGIAAFARTGDTFEYVVGDAGMGILASLRNAPEFRSIRDDLEALPLAVTPGVSRRGRSVGYGYGFRAVFLPLRAASGSVRLRSGRAVLHMTGIGAGPDKGTCSQRPDHQGVVVSVALSPNSK
jgi:hypothetical protein